MCVAKLANKEYNTDVFTGLFIRKLFVEGRMAFAVTDLDGYQLVAYRLTYRRQRNFGLPG